MNTLQSAPGASQSRPSFLPSLSVWAISFGCIVGWGSFVMPGTTFLPLAGVQGTAVALLAGAAVMLVLAANFHIMMNRTDGEGGAFFGVKRLFGYDHLFLCVWTIALAYISLVWANASAFVLIIRHLFGSVLQWGFHYTVAGFDVYAGEVLATLLILALFGCASLLPRRALRAAYTVLAVVLFAGVVTCFALVALRTHLHLSELSPRFGTAPVARNAHPAVQVFNIIALVPWAFVGFESVSLSADGRRFPKKRAFGLMAAAVVCGAAVYVLLTMLASRAPASSADAIPVFDAAQDALGPGGTALLGVCVFCALSTSLLGFYGATGKLVSAMSRDGVFPAWFGGTNRNGQPRNALLFAMAVSVVIPFLGRTAISWLTDITTISTTIAYAYISACAVATGLSERRRSFRVTGIIGIAASAVCFLFPLIPNQWTMNVLATGSYMVLVLWSVGGFILFRSLFTHDKEHRFGKVSVMFGLLFLICFSSTMWMRQATQGEIDEALENILDHYTSDLEEHQIQLSDTIKETEKAFLTEQLDDIHRAVLANSLIQLALIALTLVLMANVLSTLRKREKQLMTEKVSAEESSKAKTVFLSNMSHDIRTPMNAIIGYTNLAQKPDATAEDIRTYLGKIDSSSKHLLALINDVLEMSRIESGKMDLEETPCDLRKLMEEVRDMFATQMAGKNIIYTVDCYGLKNPLVLCDKNRLNRVLLNLISNAYKFTPENGSVSVGLFQKTPVVEPVETTRKGADADFDRLNQRTAEYELRVKDSGIGMSPEFAERVFDAFERERTSTVSGIQGTGLGMAITKSIVDLMGGTIEVHTAQGEGTEFVLDVHFRLQDAAGQGDGADGIPVSAEAERGGAEISTGSISAGRQSVATEPDSGSFQPPAGTTAVAESTAETTAAAESSTPAAPDFSAMRLLLVDDIDVNRELAQMILESRGFAVETAENGQQAVEKVASADAGYYDAVLMDIQMPVMDGHEASRAIRALADTAKAGIPIIAMTANAFAEDKQAAADAGMNAHVAKPIDEDELFGTLAEIIGK